MTMVYIHCYHYQYIGIISGPNLFIQINDIGLELVRRLGIRISFINKLYRNLVFI